MIFRDLTADKIKAISDFCYAYAHELTLSCHDKITNDKELNLKNDVAILAALQCLATHFVSTVTATHAILLSKYGLPWEEMLNFTLQTIEEHTKERVANGPGELDVIKATMDSLK